MQILYHHRTRATDAQRIHILEMVEAFRALGHDVEIVALADTEAPPADSSKDVTEASWKRLARKIPFGYELALLGYNAIGLPLLLWKFQRTSAAFLYERYSLLNFSGVLAARLCGKPVVLEVNSPLAFEQHADRDIRAVGLAARMERWTLNAASKIVVVSSPLRRMLAESGVEPSKLLVLPNGVNLGHQPDPAATAERRAALGLQGKIVIGFVGWFKKWHGLDLLLEAFEQSNLRSQGAALLLVGDGPAMPELRQYIAEKGLASDVVLAGAVPHAEIAGYLGLIDIAVQPAANAYCCPMKIIEYMALAKPIVAPRQENIEELLDDGREAVLFTPGDRQALGVALRDLVKNSAARVSLGNRAFEAIGRRRLSWKSNAEAVLNSYQSFNGNSGEANAIPTVAR